jgi:aminoglycoside N3'-acetyltransferase
MNQSLILNKFDSRELIVLLRELIGSEISTIVLHSSLLGIGVPREGLDYFADYLIEELVDKAGCRLIVPVFTFNSEKFWSPMTSKSDCGALSTCLLRKYAACRTLHPVHSVLDISSSNLPSLRGSISKTSFGADTVWEDILTNQEVLNIGMGIGLNGGGTFLHAIEQRANVPYREFITLDKTIKTNNGAINNFKYFARRSSGGSEINHDWEKVRLDLQRQDLYYEIKERFFVSVSKPADVYRYLKPKLQNHPNFLIF